MEAPDQNRTDTGSLEGYCSTIELQAQTKVVIMQNHSFFCKAERQSKIKSKNNTRFRDGERIVLIKNLMREGDILTYFRCVVGDLCGKYKRITTEITESTENGQKNILTGKSNGFSQLVCKLNTT